MIRTLEASLDHALMPAEMLNGDDSLDGLFQRVANDDHAAFEKIFRKFHGAMCSYSRQLVACPQLAEEIVDDVFCSLWWNRKRIRINASFSGYLFTSIRNRSLDCLRKRKGVQVFVLDHAQGVECSQTIACDGLIYEELREHIDGAIRQLPEQCRTIFCMSREQDLSYKDIAQKLNISIKTVDTQIGRALKHIRKRIAAID